MTFPGHGFWFPWVAALHRAWMNELRNAGQRILDEAKSIADSRGVGAESVLSEGGGGSLLVPPVRAGAPPLARRPSARESRVSVRSRGAHAELDADQPPLPIECIASSACAP